MADPHRDCPPRWLIGLALVAMFGDSRRQGTAHDPDGHSRAGPATWLLMVPIVVLTFVAPLAFRPQARMPGVSAVPTEALRRPFPPLPAGRAPEVSGAQRDAPGGPGLGRNPQRQPVIYPVIGFNLRDGGPDGRRLTGARLGTSGRRHRARTARWRFLSDSHVGDRHRYRDRRADGRVHLTVLRELLPAESASVFVHVIVVLEVPVAVVQVIDVVIVRNLLAVVVLGVRGTVIRVDLRLRMALPVVDVIDVISVHDGLMPVTRQVLVIAGFGVRSRCHRYSSEC